MTPDEAAALETLLDSLEPAPYHILLERTLAVGIPHYYIIVIGFDIEQVGQAYGHLHHSAVVI